MTSIAYSLKTPPQEKPAPVYGPVLRGAFQKIGIALWIRIFLLSLLVFGSGAFKNPRGLDLKVE